MDSVRFGRALGLGARMAARTVVSAIDAATAPNPSAIEQSAVTASSRPQVDAETSSPGPAQSVFGQPTRARNATSRGHARPHLRRGGRRFSEAIWSPLARLSGVLWLEVTGVFFGLFALSAAVAAFRLRGEWHQTPANPTGHSHLLLTLAVTLLFGYFCASSFVRARRRGRRA